MKKGWSKSRIIDITRKMFAGGDVPKQAFSKCKTDVYTIPIYANGAENDGLYGYTNEAKVSEPAVTISGRGTIGYVSKRRTPFCPVVRLITLIPNEDIISLDYLYYALYALDYSHSGSSIPQLTVPMVKEIEVSYPCLCEQKRIVERLDAAFENIDKLKANAEKQLAEARTLFQKCLAKAMEPKEGWEKKPLNYIANYSIGLTYKPTDVSETGIIVLRSSNIQEDQIDLKDIVRVSCPIKDSLFVEKGDILMCSRNGSARLVGKVAIIPEIDEKMTYGTFMMIIRSVYNPFLFYYFKSDDFRKQIKHGEANMINQITRYMLDDVILNVPPVSEQQHIVERLDSLSENIRKYEEIQRQIISECDALKQALLRKVFE